MASLIEVFKDGRIVSYRFSCCVGRDERGKQVRRSMTWHPPDGLRQSRMRAAAERAAAEWEASVRTEYADELERMSRPDPGFIPPKERRDDFCEYVNNVWYKLYICNGDRKRSTETYYKDISKYITEYFHGAILQEITPIQIQEYLQNLRHEHEKQKKKPMSDKYMHHQYGTLRNIFEYAEKNKMIAENPMKYVEAPKMRKKKVDAMDQEQAKLFFKKADESPIDLQSILYLLVTTGIRRGELVGLKWRDIDTGSGVLHVERGVSYTHGTGITVSTPKTSSSIRDVPLMPATVDVLNRYKKYMENKSPSTIIKDAYLFHMRDDIFQPIDPNAITRRVKRFMKNNGLPDLSPHDLRHPYVKHTTKIFSLRLMDFQAQAYPDARRKTRGACQLHRGGQSQSPVRPLCNRKRFSCLPPQSKISRILYAISIRLSGYTSTLSISSSASAVVSVSASKIALDASLRLSCRACSSCFCFACANTAA